MGKERDTYKYELKDGQEITYVGVTKNPESRKAQHEREGKDFSHMNIVGQASTREGAKEWEEKRLEQYRKNQGHLPKHNEDKDG